MALMVTTGGLPNHSLAFVHSGVASKSTLVRWQVFFSETAMPNKTLNENTSTNVTPNKPDCGCLAQQTNPRVAAVPLVSTCPVVPDPHHSTPQTSLVVQVDFGSTLLETAGEFISIWSEVTTLTWSEVQSATPIFLTMGGILGLAILCAGLGWRWDQKVAVRKNSTSACSDYMMSKYGDVITLLEKVEMSLEHDPSARMTQRVKFWFTFRGLETR